MTTRRAPLPRVYLAGKIEKNDWRHKVVPGLRDAINESNFEDVPFPTQRFEVLGRARYMGPFFVSDDHGCGHGHSTHGNGTQGCLQIEHRPHSYRVNVAKRCQRGIELADHLFVWLDDHTAYGTLVEVGIAVGLGKQVWIYGPHDHPQRDDLWFASHVAADGRVILVNDAEAAVNDFLDKLQMRARPA